MDQPSGKTIGRIATGAALGLVAGLALPHARKAVHLAPSLAAGGWVKALTAEHRLVEKAFEQLLATSDGEMVKREVLLARIAYALTRHAIEEENVIYPALAEHARTGEAHHLTEDHAEIKAFIYDLRRLPSTDPRWLIKAQGLRSKLQAHFHEEEDEVFPAFRDSLPKDENLRLTKMMNWEGFKVA